MGRCPQPHGRAHAPAWGRHPGTSEWVRNPPHGGIAPGIDRIVMLLANEKNIREITLFPLNQNAQDLLMRAPSEVDEKQLKELNIKIEKKISS